MMLTKNRLQDEMMAKEDAKIQRRREMQEQRRLRILNAKARIIGLDVAGLDQQVEEKQRQKNDQREMARLERLQALEIDRMLTAAVEEEQRMRQYQMEQMKASWENAKQEKELLRSQPPPTAFDVDNCGASAALKFVGEDQHREERLRLQKEQMRRWIQDQLAEKAYLKHMKLNEDAGYAEMIKAVDELREAAEREERDMRGYIQSMMKEENAMLAEGQRERNRERNNFWTDADRKPLQTSLNVFDEDKTAAVDEQGHIIRRDLFRGFTEEQIRRVRLENQQVMAEKAAHKDDERKKDYEWLMQQLLAMRAMEQAEYEEKCAREQLKEEQLAFLRKQMVEQKEQRAEWNQAKFGRIEKGYYEGFGSSCR